MPTTKFTTHQWFDMCRTASKAARSLVRRVCDSSAARSLTLAEARPAVARLTAAYSCPCGKVYHSKAGFAAHQYSAGGTVPAAHWYADPSNVCTCCLMHFSCRQLLIYHLQRGSSLCLLNTLLRVPPLSVEEEHVARKEAQSVKLAKVHTGQKENAASWPAYRLPGPPWRLLDVNGSHVPLDDKRHPLCPGRGRRDYGFAYPSET